MKSSLFRDQQRSYWDHVDETHFHWQTQAAYIAQTEASLLAEVDVRSEERLLEIGCGEGANLYHLRSKGAQLFAVDFNARKALFAAQRTGAQGAGADGERLPFCEQSFDVVLVRDLLHHVSDRVAVLGEAYRVLRLGGRICVIEPNRFNPLIFAQAAAVVAERGILGSHRDRLIGELLRVGFVDVDAKRAQAMPLSRIVLHHRLGWPWLGRSRLVTRVLRIAERAFEHAPSSLWAYLVVRGAKA